MTEFDWTWLIKTEDDWILLWLNMAEYDWI